jgi:hypothetical protein
MHLTAGLVVHIIDTKEARTLEPAASAELTREADNHIALGLLLRKDRQEPKKSAVQQVLSSALTTAEKVDKIREIDDKTDGVGVLRVLRQASAQAARGQISRISRAIKQPGRRLSYFSFLLREYGKVQQFGRRTHVLDAGIWPPGIKLDPNLPSFLVKQVQAWGSELKTRLQGVVEHGWLHLTPRQYNHVVLVKRLADRIASFDFLHLDLRETGLVLRFKRIESLFLMLHYREETLGAVLGALRTFSEKQHDPEPEIEKTHSLVARLLSEDVTLPSLYNCLVGFNIFAQRRFVTLRDLMREGLGEMVDGAGFDCDPQVRMRMDGYIDESIESIKRLHEQLQEARRINSYVTVDDGGHPDAAILERLYASADSRETYDFLADQQNLVLFGSRLLRAFDNVFSALLNGQVALRGAPGRVPVFVRSFFELEFSRIRTLIEKLETGPFHFSSFPLQRYLKIKGERLGAIGAEMDVSLLVDDAVSCLVDLGKTLTKVLGLRSPSAPSRDPPVPLEPVVLQGKAFSLPRENDLLHARSLLAGKTVAEGIAAAVTVCFTAGLLFQDDFLSLYHGKERRLAEELRRRMHLMENLLDPESWRELSALYI